MTHPWDKKYNVVFVIMLVSGIALCIGGIWLPPLLIPGGVCLTGAFAMYASAYTRMYPWRQDDVVVNTVENTQRPDTTTNNTQVNILIQDRHVEFHPHYDMIARPRNPSLEDRELHQARSAPELTLT